MRIKWLHILCLLYVLSLLAPAATAGHTTEPEAPARAVDTPSALDGDVVLTDIDDRGRLSKALTLAREYKADSPSFSKALHSVIGASAVWHWTAANGCLNYRNEALELLDRSPTAWDTHEQLHGPAARTRLDEGNKQGDLRKVRDVARRFAGTTAAREAQALLATYYVDRGHPLAAALLFEGLFASNRFKQGEARALPPAERNRRAFAYLAAATAFHQTGKTEARDHALQRAAALGSEDLAKRLLRDLGKPPGAEPLARQRDSFVEGKDSARRQAYLDALNFNTAGTLAIARAVARPANRFLMVKGTEAEILGEDYLSTIARNECQFAAVGWPAKLTKVSVRILPLDSARVSVLLRSLASRSPLELELTENLLRDAGAKLIAEAPGLKSLTALTVDWNGIGEAGARNLAESPHLKALTSLNIGRNVLQDAGAKAIAESSYLKGLTDLDLRSNRIGEVGARALAESPNLKGLVTLSLDGNYLGDEGAKAIADSLHFEALRRLNIGNNKLHPAAAIALAGSPHLKNLLSLDIGNNNIRDAGVAAIAGSKSLGSLRALDARGCQIGDAGVVRLAGSPHLKSLVSVSLQENNIGDVGAKAIAESPNFKALTTLKLFENQIDRAGAQAIAASAHLKGLVTLSLGLNHIGDAGAKAIAASDTLKSLTTLDLYKNGITDEGIVALAGSPNMRFVTHLDIGDNDIGEGGIRALISSPNFGNLTTLYWANTRITTRVRDEVLSFLERNRRRRQEANP